MTFEDLNLNTQLSHALADLKISEPTVIQQKVFPVVMSGRDVVAVAQTGTGKTFGYLLPCLRQWQYSKDKHVQILVLVPTRELVVQIVEAAEKLSVYLNVKVTGVFGGTNMNNQAAELKAGVDLLVATPGRLVDLLMTGALKARSIKKLVIDEVDEMLSLGFRAQLGTVLDLLPEKRQNLLFSATLTDDVRLLIDQYFNHPIYVEATPVGTPLENIEQQVLFVPNFHTKVNLLKWLLQHHPSMDKVLVFAATKQLADQLFQEIQEDITGGVDIIHSNKTQNYRFNSVRSFEDGSIRLLIATDIIARGLDVSGVSHVINFDTPDEPENYIHRIGRTGRASQKGNSITMVTEAEKENLLAIEALMNYEIPIQSLPGDLQISELLTPDELPRIQMPFTPLRGTSGGGAAFHEKLAKNKKVNVRRNIAAEKMQKYGRPIKRSGRK